MTNFKDAMHSIDGVFMLDAEAVLDMSCMRVSGKNVIARSITSHSFIGFFEKNITLISP